MSVENPRWLWDTDDVTREDLLNLIRRLPEKKLPEAEALLSDLVEDSSEDVGRRTGRSVRRETSAVRCFGASLGDSRPA